MVDGGSEAGVDVTAALRGERIFITGATGFIGKVLVEKLLWSVPDLDRLVLLVRPDGNRSAACRLREEILESPLMARLQARHQGGWAAWAAGKIEVVAGDLGRDRFGLDQTAYATLSAGIDRVVAGAATVAFNERLDRAVELNARGALRTLALARDAGNVPLLHVSTCFVSGRRRGTIDEAIAMPGGAGEADPEALLAELEEVAGHCDGASQTAAGAERAANNGFHDVYTLTKALGERLVERDRGAVPVAIVRPAIVESAAAEPIAGWIDGVRVADPLLVAYGRGLLRHFPGSADARLEIVPVDLVVHAMIAALAELQPGSMAPPRVYQVGSGRHPITLGELVGHARRGFRTTPFRGAGGRPIAVDRPRYLAPDPYLHRLRRRLARTRWLARLLGATRLGRHLVKAQRALEHFESVFEIYRPYIDHGARYDDSATRALWNRLSPSDKASFPFDVAQLDWPSYVADTHVPGLLRFALRYEDGLPPEARPIDAVLAQAHHHGEYPAADATTLHELFATAAAADPGAIAFQTCRDGRWLRYTYAQALTAIANVAAHLSTQLAIGAGDRVVLWGKASPEWALTSFAVHRLGAVTVPLDPQWPVDEILRAASFTGAKLICAAPELGATLEDPGCPVVDLAAPFVPAPWVGLVPDAGDLPEAGDTNGMATLLFTSGTTLAPKAVPLTHANLLANVRDLVPVMRSSRERLLSVLPIHHVFELTIGHLVPIVGNGTISYVDELKPAEIQWMMSATRPTTLVAVPRLLELLLAGVRQGVEAGGPWLARMFRLLFALSAVTRGRLGRILFASVRRRFGGDLRRIATGGSALDPEVGRTFQLMGFEVAEGYGMTETSPALAVNPWNAIRFGSVGIPLPGVEVQIRPAPGAPAASPEGLSTGEIWVRGANVMRGYYRDPAASREALRDGWLNTGDVGHLDSDGYLYISGRTKDVIVTAAGKNVYPEEVERRYRDLAGVAEMVVLGLPDAERGERVGAVVVPQPGATDDEALGSVAARSAGVPSYQQISRVEIWRGDLPKTTTLKVKRGLLREAILGRDDEGGHERTRVKKQQIPSLGARASIEPPRPVERSEEESYLLTTLAHLTRSRPDLLEPADRLIELGVDSLTRVELLSEIEARFGLIVDDETASRMASVQDVLDLVQPQAVL
jgi:long-chain acyl-CoA synthetase